VAKQQPERAAILELRKQLALLRDQFSLITQVGLRNRVLADLSQLQADLEEAYGKLNPIKLPGKSFDPLNPDTAGRMVALALMAQAKTPLGRIAKTYGSGVYAIYYQGEHPAYRAITGSETPIYVGKADPSQPGASTSREQGPQLYNRLVEHRKQIRIAGAYGVQNNLPHPLRVEDFTCRRLVCATNAQLSAERHLINVFKPVWNSDVKICWGISKHGDSSKTRSNKRSPWDVIHPGRLWALASELVDSSRPEEILAKLEGHFSNHPPFKDRAFIIEEFLRSFIQNAAVVDEQATEDDELLPDPSNADISS